MTSRFSSTIKASIPGEVPNLTGDTACVKKLLSLELNRYFTAP